MVYLSDRHLRTRRFDFHAVASVPVVVVVRHSRYAKECTWRGRKIWVRKVEGVVGVSEDDGVEESQAQFGLGDDFEVSLTEASKARR